MGGNPSTTYMIASFGQNLWSKSQFFEKPAVFYHPLELFWKIYQKMAHLYIFNFDEFLGVILTLKPKIVAKITLGIIYLFNSMSLTRLYVQKVLKISRNSEKSNTWFYPLTSFCFWWISTSSRPFTRVRVYWADRSWPEDSKNTCLAEQRWAGAEIWAFKVGFLLRNHENMKVSP